MEPYIIFMEQLMQGLEVYKLLDRIRENPVAFKLIFCHSDVLLWSYDVFNENLEVQFCDDGSSRKRMELSCYKAFLELCETSYYDGLFSIVLSSFY